MRKMIASIQKELLLLFRDKTGLILLFIMPAFLVLVVTLIQENVLKTNIGVLFLDKDGGEIGQELELLLQSSETIELIKSIDGSAVTEKKGNEAVADGSYQFCIIIPRGITNAVKKRTLGNVRNNLFNESMVEEISVPKITLYFDPTIQGSFKVAINSILSQVIQGLELKLKLEYTLDLLPEKIKMGFPEEFRTSLPENEALISFHQFERIDGDLIHINKKFATKRGFEKQPTSVQQNVPAWTLFGIFFIIMPISGSLISERETGTMLRLKAMPVSYFVIVFAKIAAYILICFGQFGIILFVGKYIIPLFGSPAFDAGTHHLAFFMILLSSICAATGYGILLGTLMKTYEQASMFGPVSVVIAAALGGIMVPVYAMPKFIQPLTILSPLSWGQNAFYDILLRGGGIKSALPEISALFLFSLVNLLIACFFIFYKDRKWGV